MTLDPKDKYAILIQDVTTYEKYRCLKIRIKLLPY